MAHGWKQQFERARRSNSPVVVNKKEVGNLPVGFETKTDLGNFYRSYKQVRGNEVVNIRELPTHYTVEVQQRLPPSHAGSSQIEVGQNRGLISQGRNKENNQPSSSGAGILAAAGGATLLWALKKFFGESKPKQTYKLFISHSWDYEDDYKRLKDRLRDVSDFEFLDYSVPQDDPLDARTKAELSQQLKSKIKQTSAVVIISGMYTSYSDCIEMEIDLAGELNKPIIGVKPWGNEQMPRKVKEEADIVVGWNAQSIVNAVQECA